MGHLNRTVPSTAPVHTPERHPRILVIDDHDGTRDIITHILQKDFDVVGLDDGAKGWERIQSDNTIVAVITDINLPNMSGIEIMQNARANADPKIKNLPIIAITGAHDKDLQRRAYLGGVTGFIYKPIDMSQLKALMQAYVHADSNVKTEEKKPEAAEPVAETAVAEMKPAETDVQIAEAKTESSSNVIDFTIPGEPVPMAAQADAPSTTTNDSSILDPIGEPIMALDDTSTPPPATETTSEPQTATPAPGSFETLSVEELEAMVKEVSANPVKIPVRYTKPPVVQSAAAPAPLEKRVSMDDALALLREQTHK